MFYKYWYAMQHNHLEIVDVINIEDGWLENLLKKQDLSHYEVRAQIYYERMVKTNGRN